MNKLHQYEQEKQKLIDKNLATEEYQRELKKLIDKLGI